MSEEGSPPERLFREYILEWSLQLIEDGDRPWFRFAPSREAVVPPGGLQLDSIPSLTAEGTMTTEELVALAGHILLGQDLPVPSQGGNGALIPWDEVPYELREETPEDAVGLVRELRAALGDANEKMRRMALRVQQADEREFRRDDAMKALSELLATFPQDHEGHWSQSAYVSPQDLDGWRNAELRARNAS